MSTDPLKSSSHEKQTLKNKRNFRRTSFTMLTSSDLTAPLLSSESAVTLNSELVRWDKPSDIRSDIRLDSQVESVTQVHDWINQVQLASSNPLVCATNEPTGTKDAQKFQQRKKFLEFKAQLAQPREDLSDSLELENQALRDQVELLELKQRESEKLLKQMQQDLSDKDFEAQMMLKKLALRKSLIKQLRLSQVSEGATVMSETV